MSIEKKFKSIDASKLKPEIFEILDNMKKRSENFTNTDVNARIEPALDTLIEKIKKFNPNAILKPKLKPKAKPNASAKKPRAESFTSKASKLMKKERITWDEAKNRVRKDIADAEKEIEKEGKKELDKLFKIVESKDFKADLEKFPKNQSKPRNTQNKKTIGSDAKRMAMPVGKRVSKKSGKAYYEYRNNRSDVNSVPAPKGEYRYKGATPPYLEDGGWISYENMSEADLFAMGGGLPNGSFQSFEQSYLPATNTPIGYAKGGDILSNVKNFLTKDVTYKTDEDGYFYITLKPIKKDRKFGRDFIPNEVFFKVPENQLSKEDVGMFFVEESNVFGSDAQLDSDDIESTFGVRLSDKSKNIYSDENKSKKGSFAKGGRTKSALNKDRKYFNKDQAWERQYSKGTDRKGYMAYGAMLETDMFEMGGGLPSGSFQSFEQSYLPATNTPIGYAKGGEINKTGNKGSARWEMKITDDEGNTSSIYAEKKSDLLQYKKMYLAKGGKTVGDTLGDFKKRLTELGDKEFIDYKEKQLENRQDLYYAFQDRLKNVHKQTIVVKDDLPFEKGGILTAHQRYVLELEGIVGIRKSAVEKLVKDNNLNEKQLLNLVIGVGRQQLQRSVIVDAVLGGLSSKANKEVVEFAKSDKALKLENGGATKRNISIVNDGIEFKESNYKTIFGDFDKDGTVNIDDAFPLNSKKSSKVEQVELKETFRKLLDVKAELDGVMYEAVDVLDKKSPKGADIYARTKTPYSIIKKLVEKRMLNPSKGLTDMVGTTIAVSNQKELNELRDKIDGGLLGKVLDRDDFYKTPNAGYRAYHYIVEYKGIPVEVQLKTKIMKKLHEVSHESYKKGTLDAKGLEKVSQTFVKADKGNKEALAEAKSLLANKKKLVSEVSTSKMAKGGAIAKLKKQMEDSIHNDYYAKGGVIGSAIFNANSKKGKISTSFGDKTKEGLIAMIENDNYSVKEIVNAIFEFNEKSNKVKTNYGDKTKEGLIAMIESARGKYAKGGKLDAKYIPSYEIYKITTKNGKVYENNYSDLEFFSGAYVSDKVVTEDEKDKNQMTLFDKGGKLPKDAIYIKRRDIASITHGTDEDDTEKIDGKFLFNGFWLDPKRDRKLIAQAKKEGLFDKKKVVAKKPTPKPTPKNGNKETVFENNGVKLIVEKGGYENSKEIAYSGKLYFGDKFVKYFPSGTYKNQQEVINRVNKYLKNVKASYHGDKGRQSVSLEKRYLVFFNDGQEMSHYFGSEKNARGFEKNVNGVSEFYKKNIGEIFGDSNKSTPKKKVVAKKSTSKIVVTKTKDIADLKSEIAKGKVTYRGLGMGKLSDDFYEVADEGGTRITVKGKEYFITENEFDKISRGSDGKLIIKFKAPEKKKKGGAINVGYKKANNIMVITKSIRKEGESWNEALTRARALNK